MIWRFLPLVGLASLVVVAFGWRAWLQRRRHGSWGIFLFRSSSFDHRVRDGLLVLGGLMLLGQALALALRPASVALLLPEPSAWLAILHPCGAALMAGGLVLLVAAQLDLGASWRIGIEEQARPGLVTSGLYRFCRNPIFLGLLLMVAGYALLLPTVLSLLLLAGFYIGVRQQIAAEEDWLLRTYGEAWRAYAGRTGRLLPGVGRRRDQ